MLEINTDQSMPVDMGQAKRASHEPTILSASLNIPIYHGQLLCLILSNNLTLLADIERQLGLAGPGRRTIICRLRQRLQHHKVRIRSQQGLGYWIDQEDRDRIAKIVDRFRGLGE